MTASYLAMEPAPLASQISTSCPPLRSSAAMAVAMPAVALILVAWTTRTFLVIRHLPCVLRRRPRGASADPAARASLSVRKCVRALGPELAGPRDALHRVRCRDVLAFTASRRCLGSRRTGPGERNPVRLIWAG